MKHHFEQQLSRFIQRVDSKAVILSYILPTLEYGDFLSCTTSSVAKLQKFQNRLLRVVVNQLGRISDMELHVKFKVLPLSYRWYLSIYPLMFNLLFLTSMLVPDINATRSIRSYRFKMPFTRSVGFSRSVFYEGLKQLRCHGYPE